MLRSWKETVRFKITQIHEKALTQGELKSVWDELKESQRENSYIEKLNPSFTLTDISYYCFSCISGEGGKMKANDIGEKRVITFTASFLMPDTSLGDLYYFFNFDNKPYKENISVPILQILKLSFREVTWPQICLNSGKYNLYISVTASTFKQLNIREFPLGKGSSWFGVRLALHESRETCKPSTWQAGFSQEKSRLKQPVGTRQNPGWWNSH